MPIVDQYGRTFKKLRVSLTNVCNFECPYCVSGINKSNNIKRVLSTEQYLKIIQKINQQTKLHSVILTGGEPLLYNSIEKLISRLKENGIPEVKLTTNGFLLKQKANSIKAAGIDSINVSLDALDESIFFTMSKRRGVEKIIEGIDRAIAIGIKVKINAVLMKDINDKELLPLLNFAKERSIIIRFLELMNMGHLYGGKHEYLFSQKEMLDKIEEVHDIISLERDPGSTGNYWITNNKQVFGIIANESAPFCNDCDRLRLDSYGNIYGCLSSTENVNILESINNTELVQENLMRALLQKQTKFKGSPVLMKNIGG